MFVIPLSHTVRRTRPGHRAHEGMASLARAVDHLFDSVPVPRAAAPAPAVRTPSLDVWETDTHYQLSFELPGADKAALKVSVQGRRVQLETVDPAPGTTQAGPAPSDAASPQGDEPPAPAAPRSLYRERLGTHYARTVSLPQEVDSDASEARFEHGVLSLSLAKRRPDGARRLNVN